MNNNGSFTGPKRILLVDDDSIFRSEFKDCFEEYGVIDAPGGQEGLSILKKPNEIELVILDVRMSGMNGIEVLTKIRRLNPQLRIVILTGYGSKDVAVEALRGQADDYIEKPMDIEATRQVIENFLGKKRGQPETGSLDTRDKIKRVEEFIRKNALKKVTLNDAAQAVFLSPKYLSRIFKENTGRNFNDYKLSLKMEEAKKILQKTGYSVEQISDKLGYQNPESFIRQFKKITRKTPAQFRVEIRREKHK